MSNLSSIIAIAFAGVAGSSVVAGGGHLVETAQTMLIKRDAQELNVAVEMFRDRYGYLPGSYPMAVETFGSHGGKIVNGHGNSAMTAEEANNAWLQLVAAGLVADDMPSVPGLGSFKAVAYEGKLWFSLDDVPLHVARVFYQRRSLSEANKGPVRVVGDQFDAQTSENAVTRQRNRLLFSMGSEWP